MICMSCGREGGAADMRPALSLMWEQVGWQCRDGEACYQAMLGRRNPGRQEDGVMSCPHEHIAYDGKGRAQCGACGEYDVTGTVFGCVHDWRDVADVVDHQICRICSATRPGHADDYATDEAD